MSSTGRSAGADRPSGATMARHADRRRERASAFAAAADLALPRLRRHCAAQTPFVPDEWKYGKRQESATLHYCVDARDPDLPVARKIGEAIATALLLQPKEHVVGENVVGETLDSLYEILLGTCDVYLGFKLIPDAYPEWMKVTRPYYRASYVFAATDAGWRSLADMPKSQAIGPTMGTGADLRLIQYLQALSPAERWSRFPMSSDEAALKALTNGTIGVALVWGPPCGRCKRTMPDSRKSACFRPIRFRRSRRMSARRYWRTNPFFATASTRRFLRSPATARSRPSWTATNFRRPP